MMASAVERTRAVLAAATPIAGRPQSRRLDPATMRAHTAYVVPLRHRNGPWDAAWFAVEADAELYAAAPELLAELVREVERLEQTKVPMAYRDAVIADRRIRALESKHDALRRENEELRAAVADKLCICQKSAPREVGGGS